MRLLTHSLLKNLFSPLPPPPSVRLSRRPSWLPPLLWSAADNDGKRPYSNFLRNLGVICAFVTAVYVLSTILLLSRSWNNVCGSVPLNVFTLVGSILALGATIVLLLTIARLSQLLRLLLLLGCVVVFAWSLLGIVWLAQASGQGCMATAPTVFGLTVTYVILFTAPALVFIVVLLVQLVALYLVERGVVMGTTAYLLTGKRQKQQFLGVSVLGDKGVGKTTVLRGLHKTASQVFAKGIGCRIIDENSSRFTVKGGRITFGEETTERTTDLVNADCVVILFSLSDRRSFQAAKIHWFPHAVAHAPVPVVLVGTHGTNVPAQLVARALEKGSVPDSLLAVPEVSLQLPSSVLLRVFSYLPNRDLVACQSVCKLWKALGRHEFCWADRSAGQVRRSEVEAFMSEVANAKVLVKSGFPKIAAYVEVDGQADGDVAGLWRKVIYYVSLNESKLAVRRTAAGRLEFTKFHY